MTILVDWVKQTVSGTPGVGPISLGSAVTGFIAFQDSGIVADNTPVYYIAKDGSNLERGIGVYNTSGTTLTRSYIQAKIESGTYTANPGTGLSLSSATIITCSAVAATNNKRGALVWHSATQSIAKETLVALQYNSEVYDTDGFHDTVTNNTRLTIPVNSGIRKVKLTLNVDWAIYNSGIRLAFIQKNGADTYGNVTTKYVTSQVTRLNVASPVIQVAEGDYFEAFGYHSSTATTINVNPYTYVTPHFFNLEVIE